MQSDLRLVPKPELHVSARLCGMVGLLRMNNDALFRHVTDMAARNPLLSVKPTRSGASDLSDVPGVATQDSLYTLVLRQISVTFSDPADLRLAYAFTEALEPSGWLGRTVAAIARDVGADPGQTDDVLVRLQGFEPTGVFARDLADCLRLQLIENGEWDEPAGRVLAHLGGFLNGGAAALAEATGLAPDIIADRLSAIRACDPKPGAAFQAEDPTMRRRPDVVVTQDDSGWQIELDRSSLPRVDLAQTDPVGDPLLMRLRADARWLVDAVRMRNQMTLNVARTVIRHQIGFLERGIAGLKPLRRLDVADRLGVHESTVGRVSTGLLVQTPTQMLELTRFYSRALGRQVGAPVSRRKLQMMLRTLITAEDPKDPLTDQVLAARLSAAGARISRRTVAKYRQSLGICGAPARGSAQG